MYNVYKKFVCELQSTDRRGVDVAISRFTLKCKNDQIDRKSSHLWYSAPMNHSIWMYSSRGYGRTPCLLTLSDPAAFHFSWRKKTCGGELGPPSKVRRITKGEYKKGPFVRRRIGIYASRCFYRCRCYSVLGRVFVFRRRERIPSSSSKQILVNN